MKLRATISAGNGTFELSWKLNITVLKPQRDISDGWHGNITSNILQIVVMATQLFWHLVSKIWKKTDKYKSNNNYDNYLKYIFDPSHTLAFYDVNFAIVLLLLARQLYMKRKLQIIHNLKISEGHP